MRAGEVDTSGIRAPVLEVFASIQGEGRYVGEPQTFLRLRGCPLRCRYCDTPGSWELRATDRARVALPHVPARREEAWATPFQAACWIAEVEPGAPRTVSVTGGEPLLWPEFVRALKGMIGSRRLHLETAGAHPRALAAVLDRCDHVSLDLKLDQDLEPPIELAREHVSSEPVPRTRGAWSETRRATLALVRDRDACGKVVVCGGRDPQVFAPLFDEVAEHAPELPVYLQPATAVRSVTAPSSSELESVLELARDRDLIVRVVPQVHRFLALP